LKTHREETAMLNATRHQITRRVTTLALGTFLLLLGQATLAVDYCHYQYRDLTPGEEFCGIALAPDGTVVYDGKTLFATAWPNSQPGTRESGFLRIFPGALDSRTRLLVGGALGGKWQLLDTRKGKVSEVDTGGSYGPAADQIAWSTDSKYAVVTYADDGFSWFFLVSAEDASKKSVFLDDNHQGFVDEASVAWLDAHRFRFSAFNCLPDRPGDPSYLDHEGYADFETCGDALESSSAPKRTYEAKLKPDGVEIRLVRIGTQDIDATAPASIAAAPDMPAQSNPAPLQITSGVMTVEGTPVNWSAPQAGSSIARFTIPNKGYENTYQLDCNNRQFLWTENRDARTRQLTNNTEGSTWRPLNPGSTKANAVFAVACGGPATFAGGTAPAPGAAGAGSSTPIPAACPNPQLIGIDHAKATILGYYLRETTSALSTGDACIAALKALNEAQAGNTQVMEYEATLRFPQGYRTDCLGRKKSSGQFEGLMAVSKMLDCAGTGPYPPIPPGGTYTETGVVRF
jgi:hypothetical protein